MRKNLFFTLISLFLTTQFLTFPSKAETETQSKQAVVCHQKLARDITTIINRPQFKRSRWGIAIHNLETEETIYSLEGDKLFIPASTVKLLTTAAALKKLGAEFRIETPIYATGELPHLDTVRIQGKGDPTITSEILENIVQQFKVLGVRSIKKLIIDDSYFSQPFINPTWEWVDTYYYYATTVNSVILNENTVELTLIPQKIGQPLKFKWTDRIAARQWQVFNQGITAPLNDEYTIKIDGVFGKPILNIRGELPQSDREDVWDLAIVDPASYFLETFRFLLSKEGINVTQGIVVTKKNNYQGERIITQMYSPTLEKLIAEINQESNNLYAEVILKILAKKLDINNEIEALETSLNSLNINSDTYSILDGSGLSRQNLVTPKMLVQLLAIMAQSTEENIYKSSLSLAGNNGTLKNRFKNTILQNNLWGKTGSLSGVITLSGYLQLSNEQSLAISILVNSFDDKNKIARQAMDEIVLLLPRLRNCI